MNSKNLYSFDLLPDESVEVEEKCQEVVSELEKTLGEPLQKYF